MTLVSTRYTSISVVALLSLEVAVLADVGNGSGRPSIQLLWSVTVAGKVMHGRVKHGMQSQLVTDAELTNQHIVSPFQDHR